MEELITALSPCFCFPEPVGGLQAALEKSLAQYRQFVQDDAEGATEEDDEDEDWFNVLYKLHTTRPLAQIVLSSYLAGIDTQERELICFCFNS